MSQDPSGDQENRRLNRMKGQLTMSCNDCRHRNPVRCIGFTSGHAEKAATAEEIDDFECPECGSTATPDPVIEFDRVTVDADTLESEPR